MPKTCLGSWSLVLIGIFFLLLSLFQALQITSQPAIITTGIFGVAGFLTGITSIMKKKERSPLVTLASLVGLYALIFTISTFTVTN